MASILSFARQRFLNKRMTLGVRLTMVIGVLILAVSALVFASVYYLEYAQAMAQLDSQAEALLSQMVVTRQWVADYGGVWTDRPGAYWWASKDGYYQKTPAMVTKELSSRAALLGYYQFHITSLKLKNPENAPSDFETEALHGFEKRPAAIAGIETIDGVRMYRYMIPLNTSEACLQCHSDQGYQVGDVRGGLSVLVPMTSVEESLTQSRFALAFAAVALVGLVMFILYTLVQRVMVSPIHQLQRVAVAVGEGRYDVSCNIQTGDELETLGHAVNQMVQGLKSSHQALNQKIDRRNLELSSLSSIALTISQSAALDDVLRIVVDETIAVMQVEGGAIQLWDDTRKALGLSVTSSLSPSLIDVLETFAFLPNELNELVLVADTQNDGRDRVFFDCGYRAFARVPLKSRNRVLGILHLFVRSPRQFTSDDSALLMCIGNQIGVAVENARNAERVEQTAIIEERNRLAREIHDSIAQALGYLNLKTDVLEGMMHRGEWSEAQREIGDVRRVVRDACYDVRESIDGLRTRVSDGIGLIPTIAAYLSEFGRRAGLLTEYSMTEGEVGLPPIVETELLRIVQEALTNVRKHARASRVKVAIENEAHYVRIIVEDDGCGFDADQLTEAQHFGLRIMRERAESLNGTFQVESEPGRGTRVMVQISHPRSQVPGLVMT